MHPEERRAAVWERRTLGAALVLLIVGVGVAATVHKTVGGVTILAAWVAALGALHRLGRAGPG